MKSKLFIRKAVYFVILIFAVSTVYPQVTGSKKQGTANALVIEADDNLQEYIISEVENGVLKVYIKKNSNIFRSSAMDAHVVVTDLKKLSISGGGDASLEGSAEVFSGEIKSGGDLQAGGFKMQTASLELTGGSDAWIHVEKELSVKGTGGAQVYVSGDPKIEANLKGGSKIHRK